LCFFTRLDAEGISVHLPHISVAYFSCTQSQRIFLSRGSDSREYNMIPIAGLFYQAPKL